MSASYWKSQRGQTVNLLHYFYRICSSSICLRALHGMETVHRTFNVSILIYLHTYLTMLTHTNGSSASPKKRILLFVNKTLHSKTTVHYYNTGSLCLMSSVFILLWLFLYFRKCFIKLRSSLCKLYLFNSIRTQIRKSDITVSYLWRVAYDISLDVRKTCAKKQQRNTVIL